MRELAYRMTLSSHFMEDNLEKDDESVLFSDTAGKRYGTGSAELTTYSFMLKCSLYKGSNERQHSDYSDPSKCRVWHVLPGRAVSG